MRGKSIILCLVMVFLFIGVTIAGHPKIPSIDQVLNLDIAFTVIDDDDDMEDVCEPHTQGYWNRQCKGYRKAMGTTKKGPPLHPDFSLEELEALFLEVDARLDMMGIQETTCDALIADPAYDPCQRAIKQYTAMLLNKAAGYIELDCCVYFGSWVIFLDDAIAEIEGYLVDMDPDMCKMASDMADLINTGVAIYPCDSPPPL